MSTSFKYPSLIAGISAFIVGITCYLLYRHYRKETYQITLGMIAPQNYFYAKCTNDCVRDKTGDSSTGQFLWLCTDKCAEIAKSRMEKGIPDLTREEYQRYNTNNQTTGISSSGLPKNIRNIIQGNNMKAVSRSSDSPNYVKHNMWNSEYLESNYCMNDVANWCAEKYCPFSNHPWCMKDCIKMRGVDCGGSVIAGDQF